jgi:molybdopterin-guanine dinucleotide biosynthesis protein A
VTACAGAGRVVVVGPERPLPVPVRWTREEPAGAGPVAALAAGLSLTSAPLVAVLAADLPWIAPALPVLRDAVDGPDADPVDAAALVDTDGRRNLLAAAWRRDALAAALGRVADPAGAAVRRLYEGIVCRDIADDGRWGRDVDTWDDLADARRRTLP